MSPAAPRPAGQPLSGGPAFVQLVDTALREQSRTSNPGWILRSGELDPQLLCRYAAGTASPSERGAVQELIARHDWARGRVTSLVKAARNDAPPSLGSAVLEAAAAGAVDPYRIAISAALAELAGAAAARAVTANDAVAFAQLGLEGSSRLLGEFALAADRTQARAALAGFSEDAGPLAEPEALARRVVALEDEEEALVAILEAV